MTKIITPDLSDNLPEVHESLVLPVSAYLEGNSHPCLKTIPDIYADLDEALEIAKLLVEVSRSAGDAINEIAEGSCNSAIAPLAYDLTYALAAIAADRALRLAAAGGGTNPVALVPESLHYENVLIGRGDEWRALHKKPFYNWLVFRALAGADDILTISEPAQWKRLRVKLGKWRQDRITLGRGGNGMHSCYLARNAQTMKEIDFPMQPVPELVLDRATIRNEAARAQICDTTTAAFSPLIKRCGLDFECAHKLGALMGRLYPESRLECRTRNHDAYERYFDRWSVDGLVTATGQAWHDTAAFFWVQCNRRGLPSVIIQHGGQYGYDDKQSNFFALDQTYPTHFVSWGWKRYSSAFDKLDRRAKIVPLPDARLSAMTDGHRPSSQRENILLVPLSKFRSLEVRFASIACEGQLLSLREKTAEVVKQCMGHFDKIIITYRSTSFDHDPLRVLLADLGDKVEVLSAREAPASVLFERAAAVFWDVTATGPFESIVYGLPTVVLMRPGRWAKDASWAEENFIASGVGAYDSGEAATNLIRFATDQQAWSAARKQVRVAIDTYALTAPDWREQWRKFLAQLTGSTAQDHDDRKAITE